MTCHDSTWMLDAERSISPIIGAGLSDAGGQRAGGITMMDGDLTLSESKGNARKRAEPARRMCRFVCLAAPVN